MNATVEPLDHWCTDGGCGAEILEQADGGATRVRRFKVTPPNGKYPKAFASEADALTWVKERGWTVA